MLNKILRNLVFILVLLIFGGFTVRGQREEIVLDQTQDAEVLVFSKNLIVKKQVKGVLVVGGNAIIEGRVEQDVATIGGSVIQKKNAYIGGDVIVFGGRYLHEDEPPLRARDKQTIVYAGYEEELKEMAKNPASIFATQFSLEFFVQRLFSILVWFLLSLLLTTIASNAISQAMTDVKLHSFKVFTIGFSAFFVILGLTFVLIAFVPSYFSIIAIAAIFLLLTLSYIFGRVVLQLIIGGWLQKKILPEPRRSESLASFIGIVVLTVLVSLPYVWVFIVLLIWAFSLGILLTFKRKSQLTAVK